ncbi:MAG: glycoside hydrolase family 16 protein [Fibrobacterales bacterium]
MVIKNLIPLFLCLSLLLAVNGCFSIDPNTVESAVLPDESSDGRHVISSSEDDEGPLSNIESSSNEESSSESSAMSSDFSSSRSESSSSEQSRGESSSILSSEVSSSESSSSVQESSSTEPVVKGEFTLVYEDEFDNLDLDYWEISDGSWDDNKTMFQPSGVDVSDGVLKLIMTKEYVPDRTCWGQRRLAAPNGESPIPGQDGSKYWSSGELRSLKMYKYGRFETTIKAPDAEHYLSTFFLFNVPRDEQWLEIDIELMSTVPGQSTTNLLIDKDGGAALWSDIAFNSELDSHDISPINHQEDNDFVIEWTSEYVAWIINDIEVRRVTEAHLIPTEPLYAIFNFWMGHESLSGSPDDDYLTGIKVQTEYHYFRYYKWSGEDDWEHDGWCGDKSWNGVRCE